jgi:uncharacterized protein YcfJ
MKKQYLAFAAIALVLGLTNAEACQVGFPGDSSVNDNQGPETVIHQCLHPVTNIALAAVAGGIIGEKVFEEVGRNRSTALLAPLTLLGAASGCSIALGIRQIGNDIKPDISDGNHHGFRKRLGSSVEDLGNRLELVSPVLTGLMVRQLASFPGAEQGFWYKDPIRLFGVGVGAFLGGVVGNWLNITDNKASVQIHGTLFLPQSNAPRSRGDLEVESTVDPEKDEVSPAPFSPNGPDIEV